MLSTVSQLIRRAFVYADVIAPIEDLQENDSSAVDLQTGLDLLNELIYTNNIAGNNWMLLSSLQYTVNPGDSTLILDGWAQILTIRS